MRDKFHYDRYRLYHAFKGLFFAMMAAVFFSVDAVAVKMVTNLHPNQLSLYRFIALFVLSMPETVKCRDHPFGPEGDRLFLVIYIYIRGFFGGLSMFLTYTAYRNLSLGEAAVILYRTPIGVTVAARIFLKEPCSIFQSVLVIITVIGVVFTVKLPSHLIGDGIVYTNENIYGFLSALGSFVCRTVQTICIRKTKDFHFAVSMFNFGWVATIENLILMTIFADYELYECGVSWIYILSVGLCSYWGLNFVTIALRYECAGPVSTVLSGGGITISFLLQTFLFHESTDAYTIVGAVLVSSCLAGASLRKLYSSLPKNFLLRKIEKWLKK